jgi:hypothetical protein
MGDWDYVTRMDRMGERADRVPAKTDGLRDRVRGNWWVNHQAAIVLLTTTALRLCAVSCGGLPTTDKPVTSAARVVRSERVTDLPHFFFVPSISRCPCHQRPSMGRQWVPQIRKLKSLLQVSHRKCSWSLMAPLAGRRLAITSLFIRQRGHWRSLPRSETKLLSRPARGSQYEALTPSHDLIDKRLGWVAGCGLFEIPQLSPCSRHWPVSASYPAQQPVT